MTIKDVLTPERVLKIISDFKSKTGFNIVFNIDTINEKHNYAYLKSEKFAQKDLGVLANNFKNVVILISIQYNENNNMLYYYANFRYDHIIGGSNGTGVLDLQGKEFNSSLKI